MTKKNDEKIPALKADLAEKTRLMAKLEKLTLPMLSQKHGLSVRQILRIARGEQRAKK